MRSGIEPAVRQVFGFASEIELGYQTIKSSLHRKMNVGRPDVAFGRRVPARFDRPKTVAPGRIRDEARETSEIGIKRHWVRVARMTVFARSIGLPDIDARKRH